MDEVPYEREALEVIRKTHTSRILSVTAGRDETDMNVKVPLKNYCEISRKTTLVFNIWFAVKKTVLQYWLNLINCFYFCYTNCDKILEWGRIDLKLDICRITEPDTGLLYYH